MLDLALIEAKFADLGARLKVESQAPRRASEAVSLDIGRDRRGEFFELRVNPQRSDLDAIVLDTKPSMRHLLLMFKGEALGEHPKLKFLCGHDERFWFVAALPKNPPASDVRQAMEALKPPIVRTAQHRAEVKTKDRVLRRTDAYVRQGEWFFLPSPNTVVNPADVVRNEPLRRGAGKAHMAEYAARIGGELVWVSSRHPNGLTAAAYARWQREHPSGKLAFRPMRRNAFVLVKGRISHPDHRTIELQGWHRVVLNTENEAPGARFVAFLD